MKKQEFWSPKVWDFHPKASKRLLIYVFSWLSMVSSFNEAKTAIKLIFEIKRNLKQRGIVAGVEWNKSVRLCFTKFIVGDSKPEGIRIKTNVKGLPVVLEDLYECLKNNPKRNSIILTILSLCRVFKGGKKVDFNDITESSKIKSDIIKEVERYYPWFITEVIKLKFNNKTKSFTKSPPKFKYWQYLLKQGPNGQSINTSLYDLRNYKNDFRDLKVLAGEEFQSLLDEYNEKTSKENWERDLPKDWSLNNPKTNYKGRIAVVPSPETKSRIIAISDYWTQNALYPLHKWIFGILKRIPNDYTFDQAKDILNFNKKNSNDSFWSLDLKSATDRFPIDIQKRILKELFGEDYANSWTSVMNKPYYFNNKEYKYNCGQPIGIYSSWALFTLCHHFIVFIACKKANVDIKGTYIILGDDIVISNDIVAKNYIKLIADLGVEISWGKTHKSNNSFEFAKRWRVGNEEQSPFPILNLVASKGWIHSIIDSFIESESRGWPKLSIKIIVEYAAMVKYNFSIPRAQFITRLANISNSIIRGYLEQMTNYDTIRSIWDEFNPDQSLPVNETSSNILLSQASKNLFCKTGKTITKIYRQLPDYLDKVRDLIDDHGADYWIKYRPDFSNDETESFENFPQAWVERKILFQVLEPNFPPIPQEKDSKVWRGIMRSLVAIDPKLKFQKDERRILIIQTNGLQKSICQILKKLKGMDNWEQTWQELKPGKSTLTPITYLFYP